MIIIEILNINFEININVVRLQCACHFPDICTCNQEFWRLLLISRFRTKLWTTLWSIYNRYEYLKFSDINKCNECRIMVRFTFINVNEYRWDHQNGQSKETSNKTKIKKKHQKKPTTQYVLDTTTRKHT